MVRHVFPCDFLFCSLSPLTFCRAFHMHGYMRFQPRSTAFRCSIRLNIRFSIQKLTWLTIFLSTQLVDIWVKLKFIPTIFRYTPLNCITLINLWYESECGNVFNILCSFADAHSGRISYIIDSEKTVEVLREKKRWIGDSATNHRHHHRHINRSKTGVVNDCVMQANHQLGQ